MDEENTKTEEEKLNEEKEERKKSDLEFLSLVLERINPAKEKLEKLNGYIEKYEDTFMEWQNIYDKKDLEDCTQKLEEIIERISSVNKL